MKIKFVLLMLCLTINIRSEYSQTQNKLFIVFRTNFKDKISWSEDKFRDFSQKISDKIGSSSLIDSLDDSNIYYPERSSFEPINNPQDLFAAVQTNTTCFISKTNRKFEKKIFDTIKVPRCYLIAGTIEEYNQLIYVKASVFFIYNSKPLKYLNLFDLKTRYYNSIRMVSEIENLKSELLNQLFAGFDDKIHVVFKPADIESLNPEYQKLKNLFPELIKSQLVISDKIKVYKDSIPIVLGVSKKAQYDITSDIFNVDKHFYIVSACTDVDENRVIISRKTSFSTVDPDTIYRNLFVMGNEFRNAILNLYSSKVEKRLKKIAIVGKTPFFTDSRDVDLVSMREISKNIMFSLLTSIKTDSDINKDYELIRDADYLNKLDKYLSINYESSDISSELNAEIVYSLQTIGTPYNKFDLVIEKYDSKSFYESRQICFIHDIKLKSIKELYINCIYNIIRNDLLDKRTDTIYCTKIKKNDCTKPDSTKSQYDFTLPSEFYDPYPWKLGVHSRIMNSFLGEPFANLFLGNNTRHAIELGIYYTALMPLIPQPPWFSLLPDIKIITSIDISFLYDFGKTYKYESINNTVKVYARSANIVINYSIPLYQRIKNLWRLYFGWGASLVDIHWFAMNDNGGSFQPGSVIQLGLEYSLNYNVYMDLNLKWMTGFNHKFKIPGELPNTMSEGYFNTVYVGIGLGYEF